MADNRTPFQRDMDANRAAAQITADRVRRQNELVRGTATRPGAGGLNQVYGYFADDPATAQARAAAVKELTALRAGKPQATVRPAGGGGMSKMIADIGSKVAKAQGNVADWANAVQDIRPTPMDRAQAYADTILRGPASIREAQAAVGLLPAPQKRLTPKDEMYGEFSKTAQAMFQNEVLAAQIKAKDDPEGARADTQSAMKRYLELYSNVLGGNPMNLMTPAPEDGRD